MGALDDRIHRTDTAGEARTPSQRDADRLLYSYAFQRLAGITQVTGTEAGEILHSRLTHTLKVAQVARRICERLMAEERDLADDHGLDPDAAEAAALAHDLGHPPFGHVAEHVLDELAEDWGGFNGNAQSFRIVTQLENKRIEFNGLDLTRRTLLGLLKYPWLRDPTVPERARSWGAYETEREQFLWARRGLLDGQPNAIAEIMDWADDVTYAVHDVEDFFRAGMVPLERLGAPEIHSDRTRLIEYTAAKHHYEGWRPSDLHDAADELFGWDMVWDRHWVGSSGDRRQLHSDMSMMLDEFINAFSLDGGGSRSIDEMIRKKVALLKSLIWIYVIDRPALKATQAGQKVVIERLHDYFLNELENGRPSRYRAFPRMARDLLEDLDAAPDSEPARRVVTDVVASLTEETAYRLHARITGGEAGSVLDAISRSMR